MKKRQLSIRQLIVFLKQHREEILAQCVKRILSDEELPASCRTRDPELIARVNEAFDSVIFLLEKKNQAPQKPLPVPSQKPTAFELRFEDGYDLIVLLRQLHHLRLALVAPLLERGTRLEAVTATAFIDAMDTCVAQEAWSLQQRSFAREQQMCERFVAVLSHDLRSPLSVLVMGCATLLQNAPLDGSFLKILRRMMSSGRRMDRMIHDLLDFTRMRLGGGFPITRGVVDLSEVCHEAIQELEVTYPRRQILCEATEGSFLGFWDRERLFQVVINLVSNAIQYGDPQTAIVVTLHTTDGSVCLRVKNRGTIIPREVIEKIFDPFSRGAFDPAARTASGSRGLGLGLSIVHEIVMAHQGTITVSSTLEEGTIFTVALPRKTLKSTHVKSMRFFV